jgi:hypothetical protein
MTVPSPSPTFIAVACTHHHIPSAEGQVFVVSFVVLLVVCLLAFWLGSRGI